MDVHASLRFLPQSPRKVRLVIDAIRGLSVSAAETRLTFLPKLAAEPVLKLLRSAIANAEHNFHLQKSDLLVRTITADGGPVQKRSFPRAFGRAAPIRHRTTHINIILGLKEGAKAPEPAKKEETDASKTTNDEPRTTNKTVKAAPKPAAAKKPRATKAKNV